jgi:hypothetical protein
MADEELWETLGQARFQFWICPNPAHHDRGRTESGFPIQTVEWRDNVAYCLTPGCGHNSTKRFCVCMDKRKGGFTNVGERGSPWWVCAICLLPTRPYAEAMMKRAAND